MSAIQERSAFALGVVALGMRLFALLVLDASYLLNAAWLTGLVVCALSLVPAVMIWLIERQKSAAPIDALTQCLGGKAVWALCALVFVFLWYEQVPALRILADSADCIALDGIPYSLLLLAPAAAIFAAACVGIRGLGGAARIFLSIACLLMPVVLLVQLPSANPRFLTPILGSSGANPFAAAFSRTGSLVLVAGLALVKGRSEQPGFAHSIPASALTGGLIACFLLILYAMLMPAMPNGPQTRSFQLDRLLSNGRQPISLQLPMLILWYGCATVSYAFDAVAAATILRFVAPRCPNWLCAALATLPPFVGALYAPTSRIFLPWLEAAFAGTVTLFLLAALIRAFVCSRKEKRHG